MANSRRFKARSSYVKPLLTSDNKTTRLKFAMSFLRPSSSGNLVFNDMFNYVHVDEKWFYLTKVKRKYYVYDDEELALRSVKSKHFITKVMFLAAVSRPHYDYGKKKNFDGKIGLWPFVEQVPAKRASKNRPKGALVTTHITVNSEVYRSVIFKNVIPAIKDKMPAATVKRGVVIQQDNAGPHSGVTTKRLRDDNCEGISILNQPSNSPDFNILDLGFFNSIQSLQYQKSTRSIDKLVSAVESAFYELPMDTLSKNFITLQKVMEQSILLHGDNNYKLPHMPKTPRLNICPNSTWSSIRVPMKVACNI
ncbi:hypothetical protein AeMF1_020566 [Aphanomyces euteiches]|nr:hypothetical protein AeMF1_020566 [Aphanomyces euteiches]KAH9187440.1 hypothetical protein AeNC1_010588 [Aphanomyces euteiches]